MGNTIKDGAGAGYSARVDAKNRLHTGTVTRSERDAAIADGELFIMGTQVVELTDAVETPVLYLKNTSDKNLYLELLTATSGPSTGGTGSWKLTIYAGIDDTSTIVSEAKTLTVGNANISSAKLFDGDAFLGETGDTIVGGQKFTTFIVTPGDRFGEDIRAVIPKGFNGVFAIQAPTGNTSMEVTANLVVYYLDTTLPS